MSTRKTDPISAKLLCEIYNAQNEDSHMKYEELSYNEILNRYGDILTNEQIETLKTNYMENIFNEIKEERQKQETKWGEQNHPILDPVLINRDAQRMCEEYEIPSEDRARQLVEIHAGRGDLTYMHILIEEISEVASCGSDTTELRKELIQSAAVLVAMIESLDRNNK